MDQSLVDGILFAVCRGEPFQAQSAPTLIRSRIEQKDDPQCRPLWDLLSYVRGKLDLILVCQPTLKFQGIHLESDLTTMIPYPKLISLRAVLVRSSVWMRVAAVSACSRQIL